MKAYHFLGFIMHQPAGNLLDLLNDNSKAYKARQFLLAYQRPVEYAERYSDVARFCVCFSGILLEQLQDPELVERISDFIDIPHMLERYTTATNIELAGTGYYHPLFPQIPKAHWREHILRGRDKVAEVFRRSPKIFFAPEMGFSCNMIPDLVRAGYEKALCEDVHLRPRQKLTWAETIYRAHLAEHAGEQIVIIPRDGKLSRIQRGGTEPDWLRQKILQKTEHLSQPALVTTWTDGENGNWFMNEHDPSNFWGRLFQVHMERVRSGEAILIPTSLDDFLEAYPPDPDALAETVTGTWEYNEDDPEATSFDDWAKTPDQREIISYINAIAEEFKRAEERVRAHPSENGEKLLKEAFDHILLAEASDNLWKHNGWLGRARQALDHARGLLGQIPSD